MSTSRKLRRRIGDVVSIPLGSEQVAFGLVLQDPLVAFFDYRCAASCIPAITEIVTKPVAFKIWVMNAALTGGEWPVLGNVQVPPKLLEAPCFVKRDPISKMISIYRDGTEVPAASPKEYEHLETAAVWSSHHVVDRLRDHFEGRPNKWVISLKP